MRRRWLGEAPLDPRARALAGSTPPLLAPHARAPAGRILGFRFIDFFSKFYFSVRVT
jgi:hypothetical protein